jgi:hypothetical protein
VSVLSLLLFAGLLACVAPAASAEQARIATLTDIPPLPQPEALHGVQESIITAPPVLDLAGQTRSAMRAATRGMAPGKLTGGPLLKLEIHPAVPSPDQRMEMPPSAPPEVPAKPVLTLPAPPRL